MILTAASLTTAREIVELLNDAGYFIEGGSKPRITDLIAPLIEAEVARAVEQSVKRIESVIYDTAQTMAERGLFVRDDFGEPNIHAIQELTAAVGAALRAAPGGEG